MSCVTYLLCLNLIKSDHVFRNPKKCDHLFFITRYGVITFIDPPLLCVETSVAKLPRSFHSQGSRFPNYKICSPKVLHFQISSPNDAQVDSIFKKGDSSKLENY